MLNSRKRKIFFLMAAILIVGGFLFANSFVSAQEIDLGLSYGQATGLGGQDIRLTIAKVIRIILGFLGIIALSIMVYGGYVYMTAGGNEDKVSEARQMIIQGVIGLVVIFAAWAIASFVVSGLQSATA